MPKKSRKADSSELLAVNEPRSEVAPGYAVGIYARSVRVTVSAIGATIGIVAVLKSEADCQIVVIQERASD